MFTSVQHFFLVFLLAASLLSFPGSQRRYAPSPKQKIKENRLLHQEGKRIYSLYQKGKIADVIPLYLRLSEKAAAVGEFELSAKYLINAGGCQLYLFRYQDALTTMTHARHVAERTGDPDYLATANANIASLYLQMGNYQGAEAAGSRALAVLRDKHPNYSRVLIPLAQSRAEQDRLGEAEPLLRKIIDGSFRRNDPDTAAWSWDYLGYRFCLNHRFAEADAALTESFRLRKLFHLRDITDSYWHLAKLRRQQGDMTAAAALLDSAFAELRKPGNLTPPWYLYFERARLLTDLGDTEGAWVDLGRAVGLARDWRAEVVANDANRLSVESTLSELYSFYVDAGSRYRANKPTWLAQDTFQAAEENRAASLRVLAERETGWHNKLPSLYWETLAKLQEAERAVRAADTPETRATALRLRAVLEELEGDSGVPHQFVVEPAARATQRKLDAETVLLSFQLGEKSSFLWALTHDGIAALTLPPRVVITKQIRDFELSVRGGRPDVDEKGAALYQLLFGALPERYLAPERWLFSLDQELFTLPLAALVIRFEAGHPVYLGAEHALQATPGALMYAGSRKHPRFEGPLLTVGDPIYNRADPRWRNPIENAGLQLRPENGVPNGPGLFPFARLWGASREIRQVAQVWGASDSIVLYGEEADRKHFWAEADRKPAIIHFATHILEASDQLNTAWIALSLDGGGKPQFLAPAEISAHKSDVGLVVLNGCGSGKGEIRAASGLMGLTRAWLASGASDVLATQWPEPDDEGKFFADFYRYLKSFPGQGPAYALRSACRNSLHAGGWRAKPQFWASYFLTGTN